ncbi:MAG: hypothetical protein OEO20_16415 [Gemmatimonadota bacterium]|nr:hypothetical protein [Gemmatimonadota bacterium]MDH3369636.1 hypothetical protein [Gemmatimonadota bacterium]MDH3479880.1 hypothetical protein [Gemmatimonadota bacterium]MDH3571340.1 hypothetical protein [Gemmatimonadota bacterium]MDH5550151.1 hypothetical protein [Gemmatimonadota bacterium]
MCRLLQNVSVLAMVAHALASPTAAQGFGGEVRAVVGFPTVNREALATVDRLTGTAFGLDAGVRFWRLELTVRYLQGPLESSIDQTKSDLVQGTVALQVRPIDFLTVGIGPQARSYISEGGTERWLAWEGRLGVDTWLLRPALRSALVLSYALGGSVNTGSAFSKGGSIEGRLEARIPRTPLWAAVGYRVEHGSLGANTGTDTLEEFLLSVAVGR